MESYSVRSSVMRSLGFHYGRLSEKCFYLFIGNPLLVEFNSKLTG